MRRECVALLGGVAVTSPLAARAQQDDRVRVLIGRVLRMQAEVGAGKIAELIKAIESRVGWTLQLPRSAGPIERRRFDRLRLLRQIPAIAEVAQLDSEAG
jgi:hypothetical protein